MFKLLIAVDSNNMPTTHNCYFLHYIYQWLKIWHMISAVSHIQYPIIRAHNVQFKAKFLTSQRTSLTVEIKDAKCLQRPSINPVSPGLSKGKWLPSLSWELNKPFHPISWITFSCPAQAFKSLNEKANYCFRLPASFLTVLKRNLFLFQ